MPFKADLHCHSNYSDGADSPEELIRLAIEKGLSGLSITDHDTIAAYDTALEAAKKLNFPLLGGVEFSASYRQDPVHILGYAFNLNHEAIHTLCQKHTLRRQKRIEKMLGKLKKLGIEIELKGKEGSYGRPHIALELMNQGIVSSIQEAFERYLGEGRPAYDPGELISVEETLETIHRAQGKAVIAHPHLIKKSSTRRAILKLPFDGIECYYARFPLSQEQQWLEIAKQKNWLITGGSDYHGANKPQSILGSSWVGEETFDLLYSHFQEVNSYPKRSCSDRT